MKRTLLAVFFLGGLTACTRSEGFLEFLKQKVRGDGSKSSPKDAEGPTPLDKAGLLEQLKGIAVSPLGNASGGAALEHMICEGERAHKNAVSGKDGKLRVAYEADAEACVGDKYKAAVTKGAKLTGGVGLATFSYTVDCPGIASDVVAKWKPSGFFNAETFRFDGPEKDCLSLGGGKSAFELDAAVSSGVDAQDPRDTKKTARFDAKRSLSIHAPGGGPCRVEVTGKAHMVRGECLHIATSRNTAKYSFAEPTLTHVVVKVVLKDVSATIGEQFYDVGSMDLDVNGWKGKVRFSDGKAPPVVELTDGREVVRVKLNGEFTGEAR